MEKPLVTLPDFITADFGPPDAQLSIRQQIIETAVRECIEKGLPPPRWQYDELLCSWFLVSP